MKYIVEIMVQSENPYRGWQLMGTFDTRQDAEEKIAYEKYVDSRPPVSTRYQYRITEKETG